MFFHAITFARSCGRCWKRRPKSAVFNASQGTWGMLMHWKTMFDRYYCIKTENICYISRYFLHYFVSPFHRCLANVISTDYARSRTGSTHLVMAANLWPRYDHIESCVAVPLTSVFVCVYVFFLLFFFFFFLLPKIPILSEFVFFFRVG